VWAVAMSNAETSGNVPWTSNRLDGEQAAHTGNGSGAASYVALVGVTDIGMRRSGGRLWR